MSSRPTRSSLISLTGVKISIRALKRCRNLRIVKIESSLLRSWIFSWPMENFPTSPPKLSPKGLLKSFCGNWKICPKKFLAKKELLIRWNSWNNRLKMMTVFMKDRHVTEKNMGLESTTSKTAIFIKDKCIKESCKAKGNTHGLIKTSMKVTSSRIKCVDSESWSLQMETYIKDNLSIIGRVETEKWSHIMEMPMKANSWIT